MTAQKPLIVAIAGMLSLAVAMGIGRFAFTPLLPMMLHDGVIDLTAASWLATSNYLGYWVGAMACALQPWLWSRLRSLPAVVHTTAVRIGLVSTVVLTLAMALQLPPAWPLWRFLAGVASAVVFVFTSGWVLVRLHELGSPKLAGLIYVGPGIGITVSGLAATGMVAGGLSAETGWLVFGVLAAGLTLLMWPQLRGTVSTSVGTTFQSGAPDTSEMALLAVAYGLAGFGYIVTATFLPVIAREALPGSIWLDLFWPLFGVGVSLGALITIRFPMHWDRRHLLMGCYALQASGILLGVWWPSLVGFGVGSLLIGLPFTAITLFAMQEVRRLRPEGTSAYIGLLTAVYGLGQIAGPLWVALLLQRSAGPAQGFALSLQSAAGSLLVGVGLFGWLARRSRAKKNLLP